MISWRIAVWANVKHYSRIRVRYMIWTLVAKFDAFCNFARRHRILKYILVLYFFQIFFSKGWGDSEGLLSLSWITPKHDTGFRIPSNGYFACHTCLCHILLLGLWIEHFVEITWTACCMNASYKFYGICLIQIIPDDLIIKNPNDLKNL